MAAPTTRVPISTEPWFAVLLLATLAAGMAAPAAASTPAPTGPDEAARVDAGRALFRVQCLTCHSAETGDGGGAQGPSLRGVFGRRAAADPEFSYSPALADSRLLWDGATLDRFLTAPARLAPGTRMAVAVPDAMQRGELIAYLAGATARSSSRTAAPSAADRSAVPSAAGVAPAAPVVEDWREDAPGRLHHIGAEALPRPYVTPSAQNPPKLVRRPPNAHLQLPPGFKAELFAAGFSGPRKMLLAVNGDVIVSDTYGGRLVVLRPAADGRGVAARETFAQGLDTPFGLAFYPDAMHPTWLYVAETHRVVRFAYRTGDFQARTRAESVVAALPSGGGHVTRDIAFSADGARLFVSVGSASNVAESMPRKTPAELGEWQSRHAPGAAWDQESDRAAVLEFRVGEPDPGQEYATGIRNCVSLTVQPATGALWCTTNERDGLGDDLVPDYSTRIARGAFYGWPWFFTGSHEDPRHASERPDLAGKVSVPDVLYQSHSAALGLTFYTASAGASAFPPEFVGDGFVSLHGSWNRSVRTGHKLVRMRMRDGVPTGEYEDFMTGFIVDDGHAWGRPVATVELADGSLLMSDDGADVIYRISYAPRPAP